MTILIDILLLIPLFLLGIVPVLKKLISIITKVICDLLHLTTKKSFNDPHKVKVNKRFKEVVGVKIVKESVTNTKRKLSINIIALSIFLVCITLFIINLDAVSGQVVSAHMYKYLKWFPLIQVPSDVNVYFTAIIFSLLSFSLTKLLQRWKETKSYRKEKKIERAKRFVLENISNREIIDEVTKSEENKKIKVLSKSKDNKKD